MYSQEMLSLAQKLETLERKVRNVLFADSRRVVVNVKVPLDFPLYVVRS